VSRSLRVALDGRTLAQPVLRGMDRYLYGLVTHLPVFGVTPTLLLREGQPVHANHRAAIPCETVELGAPGVIAWEQAAVPWHLFRRGYDLYHSPAERPLPLACPCPSVFSLHSATLESYEDLTRRGVLPGIARDYLGYDLRDAFGDPRQLYYIAARRLATRHVMTVSEFAREEIVRLVRFPAHRVTAIPLGLANEFAVERRSADVIQATLNRLKVQMPYLLYVGGYERHKNPAGLLAMMTALQEKLPAMNLVMVGSGPAHASLVQQALSLSPRVTLLHGLTTDLVDLYDAAELFVSLSWRESFGLPALEAMSRGLGVVASQTGATREVVGDAGRLVDANGCGLPGHDHRCRASDRGADAGGPIHTAGDGPSARGTLSADS
jgi:glycosyltransferase involved in cell wall biosynthesis